MENLIKNLQTLKTVCHWLGKYREAHVLTHIIVLCRKRNIMTIDDLEGWVDELPSEEEAE